MRRSTAIVLATVVLVAGAFVVLLASQPERPAASVTRPYVAMPDGVRLAVDVILPEPMPAARVPIVLYQTRYWRSFALRVPEQPGVPPIGPRDESPDRLVAAGYGVVVADVRGTGASEGTWPRPWSDDEVADARALIDWIAAQPFCDGRIGTAGVSYEGTTALLAATSANPALRAVLAREIEWDVVDELIAPGGVRNVSFVESWGAAVAALDRNHVPGFFPFSARLVAGGVHPVDGDDSGAQLNAIVSARAVADVAASVASVRSPADSFAGIPAASVGPSARAPELARTTARVGIWGGWWDGATADAVLRADASMPIAEAWIGPWNHEGDASASPFGAHAGATVESQHIVAFFDRNLKGEGARVPQRRWWVAGADSWREGAEWPTTSPMSLSLGAAGTLRSGDMGTGGVAATLDEGLDVDFAASTGTDNRWMAGLLHPVAYNDRKKARGLMSFVGAALKDPLYVFGAPILRCNAVLDGDDAALFVYLEASDANGPTRLLTEGVSRIRSGEVEVRLRSIAFELPAGSSLRVSLAGADSDTFERVPETGPRRISLRDACSLELPVVQRE